MLISQKQEKTKKVVNFMKISEQFSIRFNNFEEIIDQLMTKFNDHEAIIKQLAALIKC